MTNYVTCFFVSFLKTACHNFKIFVVGKNPNTLNPIQGVFLMMVKNLRDDRGPLDK